MVNKKSRLSIFVAGSFFLHAAIATIALTSNLPQKSKDSGVTEIEMTSVAMATPTGADEITAGQVVVKEEPVTVVEPMAISKPVVKKKAEAKAAKPTALPASKNKPVVETASINEAVVESNEPVVTLVPESQVTSEPEADLEPVPEVEAVTDSAEPASVAAAPAAVDPVESEKADMVEAAQAWKGEEPATEAATESSTESSTEAAPAASQSETASSSSNLVSEGGSGTLPSQGLVRSFEQLRAKPGNKRPSYDADERRKGLQGEVTFLAYVTQSGALSDFKMVQSTGHRSLDLKSLGAIKTWKFQSGQEGWVEIPLQWKLEGGPQVAPSVLRRKISQN